MTEDGTGHEPTSDGVLVLSVWHECPDESCFRARISVVDNRGRSSSLGTAVDSSGVLNLVSGWLDSLRGGG